MPSLQISQPAQKVLDFMLRQRLFSAGEKVVVAVSGGPDSLCLLYILRELRAKLEIGLHVAHLDHRLRGKDSAADAAYVAGLARRLHLPATIASRDVKAYRRERGLSLEEAAREVRYHYLAEVAANIGANKVVVGHTADDHVETILMHLLRGSGTRGLRGLLPASRWPSAAGALTIIRPLLELSREETVAYCRRLHLKPRMDVSNLSPGPLRNRIRHNLLAELRKYNPKAGEALRRTASIAADDFGFIESEVDRCRRIIVRAQNDSIVIDKKRLLALAPALQRGILRLAVESVAGSLKDIEASHIEDLLDALGKSAGKVIGLPFGLSFNIEYDRYVLSRNEANHCPFPALTGETVLNIPGMTHLPGWRVKASIVPRHEYIEVKDEAFSACLDYDSAGNRLTVRSGRTGDRFQPLGMTDLKKLNRFMIDARIPRSWRPSVPVIVSPERLIWVVGYRIDAR
ncbi:MAG: tRNA lysidine(34) synthetase TilS, partial [Chloroflexi bacterium RBG_13_57_8]